MQQQRTMPDGERDVHWGLSPAPFLSQPRAHSALRHELDAIGHELTLAMERCRAAEPERLFELQVLPFRLVAKLDDVAISFSWLNGRVPTVADGCLLVIAWQNVPESVRGLDALRSATALHEQTYVAEGSAPDEWRWRGDELDSQSHGSASLVAEWVARASTARAG